MFELRELKIDPKKVMNKLNEFEKFCLGETILSPEEFNDLNKDLGISAVMHIGKRKLTKGEDGKHLIWTGPDNKKHDLGLIHKLDVMRKGPGFHRSSTNSLGEEIVVENKQIEVPNLKKQVSVVELDDGSVGVGPNYKVALRNAALKKYLKKTFKKSNPPDAWLEHYGNA